MATSKPIRTAIELLRKEFERFKTGKESLLEMIDETEIPENVYNSNAIENSTLTLQETEKIILEMEISRHVSLREIFEAKNLARVMSYIRTKSKETELTKDLVLFLHQNLLTGIKDEIAGRFRTKGEFVRVGLHVAPVPEKVEYMMDELFASYSSEQSVYFIDRIARFHLEFETIHPFCDGNGRLGREIINYQFLRFGFPRIIIRDKEKKAYYEALREFNVSQKTKKMEKVLSLAVLESLHKRLAYLQGKKIITVSDYVKKNKLKAPVVLNAAKRQNICAFRERGVWKIGE